MSHSCPFIFIRFRHDTASKCWRTTWLLWQYDYRVESGRTFRMKQQISRVFRCIRCTPWRRWNARRFRTFKFSQKKRLFFRAIEAVWHHTLREFLLLEETRMGSCGRVWAPQSKHFIRSSIALWCRFNSICQVRTWFIYLLKDNTILYVSIISAGLWHWDWHSLTYWAQLYEHLMLHILAGSSNIVLLQTVSTVLASRHAFRPLVSSSFDRHSSICCVRGVSKEQLFVWCLLQRCFMTFEACSIEQWFHWRTFR